MNDSNPKLPPEAIASLRAFAMDHLDDLFDEFVECGTWVSQDDLPEADPAELAESGLIEDEDRCEALSEGAEPTKEEIKLFHDNWLESALNGEADAAKKTVLVQAYSFTSAPIARALVDAKHRGVDVQVILDKSQRGERYTSATFLANEGVPTYIDGKHKIAHNKVMVIDGETVITGSFNFTKSAEEGNAENLLVINNAPKLSLRYAQNWKDHLGHSEPYQARN
jgi:hypothetical protein